MGKKLREWKNWNFDKKIWYEKSEYIIFLYEYLIETNKTERKKEFKSMSI